MGVIAGLFRIFDITSRNLHVIGECYFEKMKHLKQVFSIFLTVAEFLKELPHLVNQGCCFLFFLTLIESEGCVMLGFLTFVSSITIKVVFFKIHNYFDK